MKLRKNKRVKDEKKAAERERALPRNRQVQNYYKKKLLGIFVLGLFTAAENFKKKFKKMKIKVIRNNDKQTKNI